MKYLKRFLLPLAAAAVCSLILFVIGSVKDYSISEKLYNSYQLNIPWYSIAITLLGPLVTNAFGSFSGSAIFLAAGNYSKKANIWFKIIGIFGMVAISFFAYTSGTEFAEVIPGIGESTVKILKILTLLIIILIDIIVFLLTLRCYKKIDPKKLLWTGFTMLAIIAITAGCGEVIKYLASRPRPRIVFPGSEEYREWYQWKPLYGFKVKESKSFISGHSANAASISVLLPLWLSITKLNEKKYTMLVGFIIGILYAFVVALSRILAIAHFMTDIAGGLVLSFIVAMALIRIFVYLEEKLGDKIPLKE